MAWPEPAPRPAVVPVAIPRHGAEIGRAAPEPGRYGARPTTSVRVRRLKLTSVAKVSIIFYLLLAAAFVGACMILWFLSNSTGLVTDTEKGVRTLFDLKTFTIRTGTVFGYTAAAGVVLAIAGTIVNIIAAALYNIISRVAGGLRIDLEAAAAEPDDTFV